MITVLAGGTGSIKLVRGLVASGNQVCVIANVGDNFWFHGLYVCPDIDTAIYGLAGILDPYRGWGIKDDTFNFLEQIGKLKEENWFKIGDRDLSTHVLRTKMLKEGFNLSEITDKVKNYYGIKTRIIPSCDSDLQTRIITDIGDLHLQEYYVKYNSSPKVLDVKYNISNNYIINPELFQIIDNSDLVVIAPANPISSIGPIIAINEIRMKLKENREKIIAISPIIGQKAVSGPAGIYMQALQLEVSPLGVSNFYSDIVGKFVISNDDIMLSQSIKGNGMDVLETDIMMRSIYEEEKLALELLEWYKSQT